MVEEKIMNVMEQINYGFLDKNYKNIIDDENEFAKKYHLQNPEELLKTKHGVCFDQVELERKLFLENGIEVFSYFIFIEDNENLPAHTFLVYKKGDKFIWFEHSWYKYKGIHTYNTLNELLVNVKERFVKSQSSNGKVYMYKYNTPNYNLNCDEFYKFCENGIRVDI